MDGNQAGDPVKAAPRRSSRGGVREPAGAAAAGHGRVGAFGMVADAQLAELEAWEQVSLATAFDAA